MSSLVHPVDGSAPSDRFKHPASDCTGRSRRRRDTGLAANRTRGADIPYSQRRCRARPLSTVAWMTCHAGAECPRMTGIMPVRRAQYRRVGDELRDAALVARCLLSPSATQSALFVVRDRPSW